MDGRTLQEDQSATHGDRLTQHNASSIDGGGGHDAHESGRRDYEFGRTEDGACGISPERIDPSRAP